MINKRINLANFHHRCSMSGTNLFTSCKSLCDGFGLAYRSLTNGHLSVMLWHPQTLRCCRSKMMCLIKDDPIHLNLCKIEANISFLPFLVSRTFSRSSSLTTGSRSWRWSWTWSDDDLLYLFLRHQAVCGNHDGTSGNIFQTMLETIGTMIIRASCPVVCNRTMPLFHKAYTTIKVFCKGYNQRPNHLHSLLKSISSANKPPRTTIIFLTPASAAPASAAPASAAPASAAWPQHTSLSLSSLSLSSTSLNRAAAVSSADALSAPFPDFPNLLR